MASLTTTYVGLTLRNPVIVSSSGLVDSVEKIKKIEEAGAGAVVLKSLFEEQINFEANGLMEENAYPEAADYIQNYTKSNNVNQYYELIKNAKEQVHIPVFASINCVNGTDWIQFARSVEEAGADGLEVNIFMLPVNEESSAKIEEKYFSLVTKIREAVKIPVVLKISSHFTNILYMVSKFYHIGVDGVVLFNRMYEPDINIKDLSMTSAEVFSTPADIRNSLRWISLVTDKLKNIQVSGSTGVHDGAAAIKMILAGAQTVQICSTLYKNGIGHLSQIISDMEIWMNEKGYTSPDEFRGKMNYRNHPNPGMWERSQFMRYFSNRH